MRSLRRHFAGWTKEPERYYDAIDFAVNSRIDPEPFGLSVVEAMLAGRPVLVHALGGPAETVVDGVTGWHVAEATSESFAAGLRRIMQDRGSLGRKRARPLESMRSPTSALRRLCRTICKLSDIRGRFRKRNPRFLAGSRSKTGVRALATS